MIQKLFLIVALSVLSFASEIVWEKSLEDVQGEKAFVLVEEDYCPWCKRFKKRVLSDAQVQEVLTPYKALSMMKDRWNIEGIAHVRFVPTVIIIDENRRVIARQDGYADKEEFLRLLQSIQ